MTPDAKASRREFLRRSGATAAAGGIGFAFPMIVESRVLGGADTPPPSERVRVGVIGVGGQGTANLKAHPEGEDRRGRRRLRRQQGPPRQG